MKKRLLVCTIGNRDVQILKEHEEEIRKIIPELRLTANNDDPRYLTLSKESNGKSFYDLSKLMHEKISIVKNYIDFPLVKENIMEGKYDKIILAATNQNQPYHQDTIHFAMIIKEMFSYYEIEIRELKEKPIIIENCRIFFNELKKEYEDWDIDLEVSGGTPQMRIGVYLNFLFRKNSNIFETDESPEKKTTNMRHFEASMMKEIIKQDMKNYRYEMLFSMRYIFRGGNSSGDIEKAIDEIEKLYNFDFGDKDKINTIEGFEERLSMLLSHCLMRLDKDDGIAFIGEFFALIQNTGYYLVILIADMIGKVTETSQKSGVLKIQYKENSNKSYRDFFKQCLGKFAVNYLKDITERRNEKTMISPKCASYALIEGKEAILENASNDAVYSLVCSFRDYSKVKGREALKDRIDAFEELWNKLKVLKNKRNSTIIAHSLDGITSEFIIKQAGYENTKDFRKEVGILFERITGKSHKNHFDALNKKLFEFFNKAGY